MKNIILVRGPEYLAEQALVGYGWREINLSKFNSFFEIDEFIKERGIDVGRQRNQIKRFFEISAGDIVVVPINRAVLIGVAVGEKSFAETPWNGANRVAVNFFKKSNGNLVKIPRYQLTEGLQSRLKIRMSIANLNEFKEEIAGYIEKLQQNLEIKFDSEFQTRVEIELKHIERSLLDRLITGQSRLESGGYGLEKLIAELLEIEGYRTHIMSKSQTNDHSDIDIRAEKSDDFSGTNIVYVQCKHHSGTTSNWGVDQLIEFEKEAPNVSLWLITTGVVSDEVKEYASEHGVSVMEGEALAAKIISQVDKLSVSTKEKLGLSVLPKLL
ncbi:restriction endonuclease [Pseudoalteromonas sp. NC201]|uniref:restriction endonuclease n=1 Tax=Pseudoalteromonas sp. NC201 TaxID=1514074 RepID=UPI000C7DC53B|nr:restriction endonuclease [Pseudoalteromonas sp. NC201]AUJ69567.1 Restriction endonuclease [Pseudoalteromonas sp. NC201]